MSCMSIVIHYNNQINQILFQLSALDWQTEITHINSQEGKS
jgi:hypothetical protein